MQSPESKNSEKTPAALASSASARTTTHNDAKSSPILHIFGRSVSKTDLFKLLGLLAFIVITVGVVWALWPLLSELFQEGGTEKMIDKVRSAGPWGVLILLAFQLLQIIVAFIPGEVVQVSAGILYGPWGGSAIILLGCLISSWIIYQIVHRLGQPFVEDMVPTKYLEKFQAFEESGRLDVMVFILFLIPAMPKDTFTYLVPLTKMSLKRYLVITTVARTPGVVVSTLAASGLAEGNIAVGVAIFAVVAVLAVLAIVFREKLMGLGDRFGKKD